MRNVLRLGLVLALAIASYATAAAAFVGDDGACYEDLARLCSDHPRGVRERVQCLLERRADLSPACSAAIAGIEADRAAHDEAAQGPCRDDVAALCPDVEASGGDVAGCLRPHADRISAACRAALGEALGQ